MYNKGVPIYFLLIYLGVLCPYLRESTMHLCCIVKRAGTVYWEDNVPGSLLPVSGFHRCLFFKAAEKGWGVVEIYLDNKKLVLINIIFFKCVFIFVLKHIFFILHSTPKKIAECFSKKRIYWWKNCRKVLPGPDSYQNVSLM